VLGGRRPVVFVCGHLDEADDVADDLELFSGSRPAVLPSLETAGNLGRVSEEQAADRMRLVLRIAQGKPPTALVVPVQALMQPVPARDELKHLVRKLSGGMTMEPEKLIVWLADHGYNRVEQCEVPGDFAVRGGIVDIYCAGEYDDAKAADGEEVGCTVRVDFFGDQIESVKRFDIDTLGSGGTLPEVTLVDIRASSRTPADRRTCSRI
jgi:transcription-repair coupling factor (superfamily II helicase)